jgi:pimeloyl-ACP methyl ester carboxylesterase
VRTRLAYDEAGSGHAVVLVHGHPFDSSMWAPQLRSPPAGLRLIAPDLPGYGRSAPRGPVMSMRAFADAVIELLDALDVARCVAVGLSMGGLVVMELGLHHAERIDGVVLAATTAAPVTDAEQRQREDQAALIEREGMLPVALDMAARLLGPAGRRDPALTSRLLDMMLHAPPAGAAAALRGRSRRPDYAALLGGLRAPALVVAGDQDPYAPEPVVEQLVRALPEPAVLRLPGVGHLPNLEAPERFTAALASFVETAARRAP